MKLLQDLKQEILDNKLQKFYVFYGEDYGIRKHYIDKLSTFFGKTVICNSCEQLSTQTVTNSFFTQKQLIIIYNDIQFAKSSTRVIQTFISRLKTDSVILVYEEELPTSTLFKEFSQYITYFPVVESKIAVEFVESELSLVPQNKEKLAKNCKNNYNNILLEADKIKSYAQAKNITQENAYEALEITNQLLQEYEVFNSYQFMEDVLTGQFEKLTYWVHIVKHNNTERFYYSLTSMFYDALIAFLVTKYGRRDGSSRCYNYKLPWGRTKTIRDLNVYYTSKDLLTIANGICSIDRKVKRGELQVDNLIDYFITYII